MACFKKAVADHSPKMWPGKILRRALRNIADGQAYKVPSTIDDPAILPEIEDAVESIGYGKK